MPTFIDESGDPGVDDGSSPHFCLALVYFETIEEAENCRVAIKRFRKEVLKKGERYEFKSSMGRPSDHEAFFSHLDKQKYNYSYCQVNKEIIEDCRLSKSYVVELATQGLAAAMLDFYKIAEQSKGSPLNERVLHDHHTDPAYASAIRDAFVSLKSDRKPGASLVKRALHDNLVLHENPGGCTITPSQIRHQCKTVLLLVRCEWCRSS